MLKNKNTKILSAIDELLENKIKFCIYHAQDIQKNLNLVSEIKKQLKKNLPVGAKQSSKQLKIQISQLLKNMKELEG